MCACVPVSVLVSVSVSACAVVVCVCAWERACLNRTPPKDVTPFILSRLAFLFLGMHSAIRSDQVSEDKIR